MVVAASEKSWMPVTLNLSKVINLSYILLCRALTINCPDWREEGAVAPDGNGYKPFLESSKACRIMIQWRNENENRFITRHKGHKGYLLPECVRQGL
jgi:hypothetical protein